MPGKQGPGGRKQGSQGAARLDRIPPRGNGNTFSELQGGRGRQRRTKRPTHVLRTPAPAPHPPPAFLHPEWSPDRHSRSQRVILPLPGRPPPERPSLAGGMGCAVGRGTRALGDRGGRRPGGRLALVGVSQTGHRGPGSTPHLGRGHRWGSGERGMRDTQGPEQVRDPRRAVSVKPSAGGPLVTPRPGAQRRPARGLLGDVAGTPRGRWAGEGAGLTRPDQKVAGEAQGRECPRGRGWAAKGQKGSCCSGPQTGPLPHGDLPAPQGVSGT